MPKSSPPGPIAPSHRTESAAVAARERFRSADAYRVAREWNRYEGTPQRELFLGLRRRFLRRHPGSGPWVVDLGSGPGRFTEDLGPGRARRVAVDLSSEMLRFEPPPVPGEPEHRGGSIDRLRGDAVRPPLRAQGFGTVAVLGNTLGFAGDDSDRILAAAEELVAPSGTLLLEVAPGPGESSRYLGRLPERAVARLLRAPVQAVLPRVLREGFDPEPPRKESPGGFRRIDASALRERLRGAGWAVRETLAVAPGLGPRPRRIAAVSEDPKAWTHLIEMEEALGRDPKRWPRAAAVLVAASAASGTNAALSNPAPP